MDQHAARFVTSDIVLKQPRSMATQTRRAMPGPSGQDVTITLTEREWQILATIVNELGRPWMEIVKTVERLRESDLDMALSAYLYAYEDDWRVNDPVGYELYFPTKW